jgi:hypothetical protein
VRAVGNHHAKRAIVGYQAALARVRVAKGRAAAHLCADCGRPADEWSYNRDDSAEQLQHVLSGRPYGRYLYRVPYSLDPAHYSPRCRSCSRRLGDRRHPNAKRRAYCGSVHVGDVFGRLVVVELGPPERRGKARCVCSCGAVIVVERSSLTGGDTRSCGCLHRELLAVRNRAPVVVARFVATSPRVSSPQRPAPDPAAPAALGGAFQQFPGGNRDSAPGGQ